MVTARLNYKVYVHTGVQPNATGRVHTFLDTREASSFICKSLISSEHCGNIRPLTPYVKLRDYNKGPLPLDVHNRLQVQVGDLMQSIKFYEVKRLAAPVLLELDSCYQHLESICPRKRFVGSNERSTMLIARVPLARLVPIKLFPKLYDSHQCSTPNGDAHVD